MKNRSPLLRIFLNAVLFASILFFPWWMSILLFLVLLFYYEAVEIIAWGFLMDLLYSAPIPLYGNSTILFTLFAVLLFLLAGFLKQRLIFYS